MLRVTSSTSATQTESAQSLSVRGMERGMNDVCHRLATLGYENRDCVQINDGWLD